MYPLDFEEFMRAINENSLSELIKQSFNKKQALPESLHEKAMLLFKEFILVGGMPYSLVVYIENNKDFEKADHEKRDILSLYRNDIMKIKGADRAMALSIFIKFPDFYLNMRKELFFKILFQVQCLINMKKLFSG